MKQSRGSGRMQPQSSGATGEQAQLESDLRCAQRLLTDGRKRETSAILERWTARGFTALIVGEFKRGKSSLLNALLGEDVLPTGVAPVTAAPTRVSSGPRRRAVVRFLDGGERDISPEEVGDYVDESRNPGNRLRVATVDVVVESGPPPGVVIVDVPGIGSIHKHSTESALLALPEADVALVVASVDPPVGEEELLLMREVRRHAVRVEVVLNKVDYLDDVGRRAAEEFTRRALSSGGFGDTTVWPVSARDGLRARLSHDDVGWRRSGMEALSAHLARLFKEDRESLLARSLTRKAGFLLEQEIALLDVQQAAAERSADELRRIIHTFRARRAAAERDSSEALLVFRRRFDGLFTGFSERAAEAWREPRAAFELRIREIQAPRARRSRSEAWKQMETEARDAVTAFMDRFLPAEVPRLADGYAALCAEVSQAAATGAQGVWRLAADLLPIEPPGVEPPAVPPAPCPASVQFGSVSLLLDDFEDAAAWLLPRGAALRRLAARAREEAEGRYGGVVERSRDVFGRAYEGHFQSVLGAFIESSQQTARAIETALAVGEGRSRNLEARRASHSPADGRRSALRDLRRRLGLIEEAT
jgi:Dynamin family